MHHPSNGVFPGPGRENLLPDYTPVASLVKVRHVTARWPGGNTKEWEGEQSAVYTVRSYCNVPSHRIIISPALTHLHGWTTTTSKQARATNTIYLARLSLIRVPALCRVALTSPSSSSSICTSPNASIISISCPVVLRVSTSTPRLILLRISSTHVVWRPSPPSHTYAEMRRHTTFDFVSPVPPYHGYSYIN